MKTPVFAIALLALPLLGGQALAAETCVLAKGAAAQPQEALQQQLEAEGWQVQEITRDGGCYQVQATKADGAHLQSRFNAATLQVADASDETQISSFLNSIQNGPTGGDDDNDSGESEGHEGGEHEGGEHGEGDDD